MKYIKLFENFEEKIEDGFGTLNYNFYESFKECTSLKSPVQFLNNTNNVNFCVSFDEWVCNKDNQQRDESWQMEKSWFQKLKKNEKNTI